MTTTRLETLPATWDDARDLPFFRVTDRLFSPGFCSGAGVLLASYDDAHGTPGTPAATELRTVTSTPVSPDAHTPPEGGLVPVQVRRTR